MEKEGDLVLSVATNDLSDVWGVFGKVRRMDYMHL